MAVIKKPWFKYQLNLDNFLGFLDWTKFDIKLLLNINNLIVINFYSNGGWHCKWFSYYNIAVNDAIILLS